MTRTPDPNDWSVQTDRAPTGTRSRLAVGLYLAGIICLAFVIGRVVVYERLFAAAVGTTRFAEGVDTDSLDRIRRGMSRDQVRACLGDPIETRPRTDALGGDIEYYSIPVNADVSYVELSVVFDRDHRVVGIKRGLVLNH